IWRASSVRVVSGYAFRRTAKMYISIPRPWGATLSLSDPCAKDLCIPVALVDLAAPLTHTRQAQHRRSRSYLLRSCLRIVVASEGRNIWTVRAFTLLFKVNVASTTAR